MHTNPPVACDFQACSDRLPVIPGLFVFAAETLMKRLFRGPATFWNQHYWNHFKLIVLPIALLDVIADFMNPDGLIRGPVRLAPILRPVLFTANVRSIRETMVRFTFVGAFPRCFRAVSPLILARLCVCDRSRPFISSGTLRSCSA